MKVLHFIESLGVGGAETLLVNVLPELRRQGVEGLVVVLRKPFDLRGVLEESGVRVLPLSVRGKWRLLSAARELSKIVRREGVDLVHSHLYFPSIVTALSRRIGLHEAGCVATFHNLAYAPGANKAGLGLLFRRRLAAFLYPKGFDQFIAVSSAVADHYMRHLGLLRVTVLHNPLPEILDAPPAIGRRRARVPGGQLSILVPGRLVHEKGHVDLVDALSLLRREGREFKVTLVGDGPLREMIQARILGAGLESRVSLVGQLPHSDLLDAIRDADIVAVPSRFEGFGLTALEGMALGKPVVATETGGLPEVVEDGVTGMLVPPRDPEALADALRVLMDDAGLRARMGEAGITRSRREFSLPVIVARLCEIYGRVGPRPDRGR